MSSQEAIKRATERARRKTLIAQRAAYGLAPLPRFGPWYVFDPLAAQQEAAAGGWSVGNPQPASAVVVARASVVAEASVAATNPVVASGSSVIAPGKIKNNGCASTAKIPKRKERYADSGDEEEDEDYENDDTSSQLHDTSQPVVAGVSKSLTTPSDSKPKPKPKDFSSDVNYRSRHASPSKSTDTLTPGNDKSRARRSRTSRPRHAAAPVNFALSRHSLGEEDVVAEQEGINCLPAIVMREGMVNLMEVARRKLANRPEDLRVAEEAVEDEMRLRGV